MESTNTPRRAKGHAGADAAAATDLAAQLGALYETLAAGRAVGTSASRPLSRRPSVPANSPLLARHAARVEQARRELDGLEALRGAIAALVDRLQFGVVFLDDGGRILRANAVARAMFEGRRAVCVRGGRLAAVDPGPAVAVQQAIRRAASGREDDGLVASGEIVSLGSGSGRRRIAALILPLTTPAGILRNGPAVALLLTDPQSGLSSPVSLLQQLFGFTERESEVACALLEGRSPKQTAVRLGVSVHTVRTHLKRIMETTYARRQSELVRQLSLAIPTVRFS